MDDDNGIRIILSPVQLAAVLSDQSVSEGETLTNRLWGGLGLLGGVAELFGAGALCIAPEPTMITHESATGRYPGGHTLERHMGKTLQELIARLGRRPKLDHASSFRNMSEAEVLTSKVLNTNKRQLELLVKNVQDCYKVSVTVEFTQFQGNPFFIISSYPKV